MATMIGTITSTSTTSATVTLTSGSLPTWILSSISSSSPSALNPQISAYDGNDPYFNVAESYGIKYAGIVSTDYIPNITNISSSTSFTIQTALGTAIPSGTKSGLRIYIGQLWSEGMKYSIYQNSADVQGGYESPTTTDYSLGTGSFGEDGGGSVDLSPVGITGSLWFFADNFWATGFNQSRGVAGTGTLEFMHNIMAVQSGNNLTTSGTFQFYLRQLPNGNYTEYVPNSNSGYCYWTFSATLLSGSTPSAHRILLYTTRLQRNSQRTYVGINNTTQNYGGEWYPGGSTFVISNFVNSSGKLNGSPLNWTITELPNNRPGGNGGASFREGDYYYGTQTFTSTLNVGTGTNRFLALKRYRVEDIESDPPNFGAPEFWCSNGQWVDFANFYNEDFPVESSVQRWFSPGGVIIDSPNSIWKKSNGNYLRCSAQPLAFPVGLVVAEQTTITEPIVSSGYPYTSSLRVVYSPPNDIFCNPDYSSSLTFYQGWAHTEQTWSGKDTDDVLLSFSTNGSALKDPINYWVQFVRVAGL